MGDFSSRIVGHLPRSVPELVDKAAGADRLDYVNSPSLPQPVFDISPVVLEGQLVRLEPLTLEHYDEMVQVALDPSIWRWTQRRLMKAQDVREFIEIGLAEAAAGTSMPWATRIKLDGRLAGSTRFMDIVAPHRTLEIGGTWLNPAFHRTGINVEAKYLQLRHAFEAMGARRVSLKTHHANLKSQNAIRALGATHEGVFRNHLVHSDGSARHSHWFSIIAEEWPEVKARLAARLAASRAASSESDDNQ
jgi:N-acetyltransferase